MKKLLVFIAFIAITVKADAQNFNPYTLYNNNGTVVRTDDGNFEKVLSGYNTDTAVHHHINFKFDTFDRAVPIASFREYIKKSYKGKGFSMLDAMSLVYFSMRDGKIGDHPMNKKGNLFIINDKGRIHILLFGWSDTQHKWAMAIVGEHRYSQLLNLFSINHSQIIYAAK